MKASGGDALVGSAVAMLGLLGLFLAAGAQDDEMYVFGLSLAGFAAVFVFGLIRVHYNRLEQAASKAPVHA